MKIFRIVALSLILIVTVFSVGAQQPGQQQAKKKRLLAIGMSAGWQHDSVSDALGTLYKLGVETGLWETYIRTDTQLITKKRLPMNAKNLDYFDAIFFMTTGELPLDDEQKAALLSFVRDDGKGFLGAHNATDTLYQWPEYGDLIGGYFDGHPWMTFNAPIKVVDPSFPGMSNFPAEFQIVDEIYQTKQFDPAKARVLMTLDTTKVDMTRRGVKHDSVPITWVKDYGKGRVFYCGLGHPPEVWQRADIQKMWVEAVKWAMGMIPGDATPQQR
jgi:type 1 glutamine amidotransferase